MSKTASYALVGVAAILVGGVSLWLIAHSGRQNADPKSVDGQTGDSKVAVAAPRVFTIEGMSCQGCADSITSALTQIPGVRSAKVSLVHKRAVVAANEPEVPTERILAAITGAGYSGHLASATDGDTTTETLEGAPGDHGPKHHPMQMNKMFSNPDANVQEFVERFENESRDIYVKRQEIASAVGLRPGESVADIGAGTGLFTQLFAEQVGPKGTVYAVDIGPALLKHINEQAKKRGHERIIRTVLNNQESTELPASSIDVAFVCDTYHHFEHPEKMLASVHKALRPGGRLVIIDFDLRKDSSEFVKMRARAAKEVYYREINSAGFERIDPKGPPVIKDNFYAEFRRIESKPTLSPPCVEVPQYATQQQREREMNQSGMDFSMGRQIPDRHRNVSCQLCCFRRF